MSDATALDDRRRVMTSPDDLIAGAVTTACGSPMRNKARIADGFFNEGYATDAANLVEQERSYHRTTDSTGGF